MPRPSGADSLAQYFPSAYALGYVMPRLAALEPFILINLAHA